MKLLHSDQRLLVQVHPDKEKSKRYFNLPFGKTETWYVLDTTPGETTYVWVAFALKQHRKSFGH